MQVLYQRCAAIDVGEDEIVIAVRVPGDGPEGRVTVTRAYKAFFGVLKEAARWLTGLGVTHVAVEATGIYSMPVYHAVIEHDSFEQVLVCNPGHAKNVPGRKTDPLTKHSDVPAGHRLGGALPLRPLTGGGPHLRGHKGMRARMRAHRKRKYGPYHPPAFSSLLLVTPARNGLVTVQNGS